MPIFLLLVGAIFLTAAVRGKEQVDLLFATLKDDFTGPNNFIVWCMALLLITGVGYYKPLKPLSNAFLVLVFCVIFLSNKGLPQKFIDQVRG